MVALRAISRDERKNAVKASSMRRAFSGSLSMRLITVESVLNRKCGSIWDWRSLSSVSMAFFSRSSRFIFSSEILASEMKT